MRCPKCGYITFDRVERCGKCAHDLQAAAAQLRGPMAKGAAPMFLGGLLRAGEGVVAAEPVFDLGEETLDFGEMGVEGEVASLAEEEAPVATEAEAEEAAIEMPSLSGIDVSDLMPSQEAVAPAAIPEEEEAGGIVMPETLMEQATPPSAASDDGLSLNFDLTGGETRGEADLAPDEESSSGGVLDLADLLDAAEEPAGAPSAAGVADDLSLFLEDEATPKPAAAAPEQLSLSLESSSAEGLDLTLDDAAPAATPAAGAASHPDIPDLGLTLESDGKDETPAA